MIGAILLAAGASRRFGPPNKLLTEIAGEAMIARVVREARAGGVGELIVVTGAYADEVQGALAREHARSIYNERWAEGMGSSIGAGVGALSPDVRAAFVLLGDMPRIGAREIASLISSFREAGEARVIVPVDASGEQRNPVLWPRRFFRDLSALSGDKGAKALIAALGAEDRLDVLFSDALIFADIDTAHDLVTFVGEVA